MPATAVHLEEIIYLFYSPTHQKDTFMNEGKCKINLHRSVGWFFYDRNSVQNESYKNCLLAE